MDGKKHLHMVDWDKITKPKQEGGLGSRKLTHMIKTCQTKLCWKFYKGDKELWCNVLWEKYGRKNQTGGIGEAKIHDSSLWKNIVKTWNLYENMSVDYWKWLECSHME